MVYNIVVSNALQTRYEQCNTFEALKEVLPFLKSVSATHATVVYHTSSDTEEDIWQEFSNLYKTFGPSIRLFYINSQPQQSISMVITALKGTIYEEDFYLEDEELLLELLEQKPLDVTRASLDTVVDFVTAFSKGEERVNSVLYLEQVQNAVEALSSEIQLKDEQLQCASSTALEMFRKVEGYVTQVAALQDKIAKQMDEIQRKAISPTPSLPSLSNTSNLFVSFNYAYKNNIIYLREYRKTLFVTTFALLYRKFITISNRKTCRLVILCSSDINEFARLSNIQGAVVIRSTTKDNQTLYREDAGDVFITDCPTVDVFTRLLNVDIQTFIVLDRTHQTQPIVKGSFKKLTFYPSELDMEQAKGTLSESAFSVLPVEGAVLNIPILGVKDRANKERTLQLGLQQKKVFEQANAYFKDVVGV